MEYYEIGLKWDNPDGSEEYVENAQTVKEEKTSPLSNTDKKTIESSRLSESSLGKLDSENKSITKDKDTNKWLEYTNPIYGFSLEYPDNWKVIEGNRFKNIPGIIAPETVNTTKNLNSIFNDYSNYDNGFLIFGQLPVFLKSNITDLNERIYDRLIFQFNKNKENKFSNWEIFEITPHKQINKNVDAISAIVILHDVLNGESRVVLESIFVPIKKRIDYFIFIGNTDTFDQNNVFENRNYIFNSINPLDVDKISIKPRLVSHEDVGNLSNQKEKENKKLTIQEGSATIGNPAYEPHLITIKQGETILVNNVDAMPHTVTSGEGPNDANSGKLFDTSIINGSESTLLQITNIGPGAYNYYCTVHPYMTGVLMVE